jgi:hypothetical protein
LGAALLTCGIASETSLFSAITRPTVRSEISPLAHVQGV